MSLKSIFKKVAPYILAGSIAVGSAACTDIQEDRAGTFKVSAADKSEIVEVVKDIKRIYEECTKDIKNCDEKAYVENAAKIGNYTIQSEGFDVSDMDITNDKNLVPENVRKNSGAYLDQSGYAWINVYNSEGDKVRDPLKVIKSYFHESGHRVHDRVYDNKDENNELISEFFEVYLPLKLFKDFSNSPDVTGLAKGNTFFDGFWTRLAGSYQNTYCDQTSDSVCKYISAEYEDMKAFGQEKNFNKTVENLAKFSGEMSASMDMFSDFMQDRGCQTISKGVGAFREWFYTDNETAKDNSEIERYLGRNDGNVCADNFRIEY
jgi:hypothetical protein